MKEARASMERADHRTGAERLGKRTASFADELHRGPQHESVLRHRALELSLNMGGGRLIARELGKSVAIGCDRDRAMRQ